MGLQEYNRKREFNRTPEPKGEVPRRRGGPLSFVVQLHHARARHYDLRLEVDGVLRSWAVPRGPSFRPGEKRLAVETEDHPLTYSHFEGLIPEGEYGAGHMAIFDHGTWEPEGDLHEAIENGRIDFTLKGERLKGRWTLIRTHQRGSRAQWMLLKRTDEFAADLEADDLIGELPAPPPDAPGASTRQGLEIREKKGFDTGTKDMQKARKTATRKSAAKTPKQASSTRAAKPAKGAALRAQASAAIRGNPSARANRDLRALKRQAAKLADGAKFVMGQFVQPMLTVSAEHAPPADDWIHEWKWDGYRLLGQSGPEPMLWSRNGIPWNDRVPELIAMLGGLGASAVMDGELIAVDASGYSDFNALQKALSDKDARNLRYVVFDLLAFDGHDLRRAPLVERKALLEKFLDGADPRFFYSTHIAGHGPKIFDAARERGMEGIISKRAQSRYVDGRSREWLKIKTAETRDFVVVGYTPPKGSRQGLGSLMLGQYKDGALVYAGRVGSGMNNDFLLGLIKRLRALEVDEPVVEVPRHVPLPKGRINWVKPKMVVEVFFRGWGKEGLVRQASFHRIRDDKPATAAALEQPEPGAPVRKAAARAAAKPASAKSPARKVAKQPARAAESTSKGAAATRTVNPSSAKRRGKPSFDLDTSALPQLSSPDRVVYPDSGYTKQDVWNYYLAVAPKLLEEIGGRLLSIVRCPDGIDGQHFFQKHTRHGFSEAVKQYQLTENDGNQAAYFYVDSVAGLMSLVQMNALEIHPWGSRIETLEQPDRIVFDLDPDPSIEWPAIRAAAKEVRNRLLEAGLESFPKLSGGKGVHVVAPLLPHATWDTVRDFCDAFANAMEQQAPERYVATMSKSKRRGRIFIDWLRNGRGATSVASWSLRAREGAPVAVPVTWAELSRVKSPARYTLADAAKREMPDEAKRIIENAKPLSV
ncbi:DNA ligase D [Cognatilysobacter lacus]|uniref:DNA ligase (ATP) n=1 Tax=Cognatilysobacter lacus TaxID=1643323 RepID=A0A5D8ZCK1_9GAMM|nr:DNA ligase D [Lysobacter lacus]TZF90394.1 DNA ligase D [Lysobacter lacus]